jgi:SAM-dependent methyltransferase
MSAAEQFVKDPASREDRPSTHSSAAGLEQHNREIHENRRHWERKPLLQRVYSQFYRAIAAHIVPSVPGLIVELGSGMGNVKEHIPQCITTDVFANPWLDRVENAYALSFPDATVGHLILFDVWHHLQYPGTALREFARVLAPNGRIILFEPAMGLIGRFVFGCFHHEPLGLKDPIEWEAPSGSAPAAYYAAQGNASRVFGTDAFKGRLGDWRIAEVAYFSGLGYVASGGFRGPQLYPAAALPLLNGIDSILSKASSLASRMLVVLERNSAASPKESRP